MVYKQKREDSMPNKKKSDREVDWTQFHRREHSWRTELLGELSTSFAIPRYVELFFSTFGDDRAGKFLELGAGNGEVPEIIQASRNPCVKEYLATEIFIDGAQWLKQKGLKTCVVDALHIPFKEDSFDAVISWDVMHHVSDPWQMACEMIRVSKGKLLLTEANGWSLGRKIMEQTSGHKAAGERSYTPSKYRSFFAENDCQLTRFDIHPFLFPIPGGVSNSLLKPLIWFNRAIEKIPFLRWQCSNVFMQIEFRK